MVRFKSADDYRSTSRRAITALALPVPSVQARRGQLLFGDHTLSDAFPTRALLGRFTRLVWADDRQVLKFAARWGALGLCAHGMPVMLCDARRRCEEPAFTDDGKTCEEIEHWRAWADRFAAVVAVARNIEADRESPPGLLIRAFGRSPINTDLWSTRALRRVYVARLLNRFLTAGHAGREVVTVRGAWAIVDGSRSLFGALALRLAQEIVSVQSLALCIECGAGFEADRRTARFCSSCIRRGAPQKHAMRARRRRLREAGLTARGTPRQATR